MFGRFIINVLFGSEYIDSYYVTILIFGGIPFMSIFKILNPIFQARGEWKKYVTTLVFAVISNILLNLLLISNYNMYGAAIASAVSYGISGGILLLLFIKEFKVSIFDCLFIKKSDLKRLFLLIKK